MIVTTSSTRSECRPARPAAHSAEARSAAARSRKAQHRAEDGPAAAEDRRTAEHDGGDRRQFVAGAGVGFRLAEMRDVDDGRETRCQPGEAINDVQVVRRTLIPAYRAPSGEKPIA